MATDPPLDLSLAPLDGDAHTLAEWLTTFHLAPVVIDPYTNECAWILETAARIMQSMAGADVRVAWLVTSDADDARAFLGPLAEQFLTLLDPDRAAVRALGLQRLPAFLLVMMDGSVAAAAEGWQPLEWRAVAAKIADATAWSKPLIPIPSDPLPYEGSPALGAPALD